MSNIQQLINKHNSKVENEGSRSKNEEKQCNCKKKELCPLNGKCLEKSVIYKANVKLADAQNRKDKEYIGLTGNTFKTRYNQHLHTFKKAELENETELSKYIWSLKKSGANFNVEWEIKEHAK